MDIFNPSFMATSFYGFFSVIIYTSIVSVIIWDKNRNLNSSFFTIFIIGYFINLLTFLNSFITIRLPLNTCRDCSLSFLFNSGEFSTFPLGIFYSISINMAFIQTSMTLLVSVNRFTTFTMISNKDKIWSFKILPPVMIIILFCPFIITYPVIIGPTYYFYYESLSAYRTKTESDLSIILLVLNGFMILVAVLSAIVNLLSLRFLKKLENGLKKSERALLYTTFISFIIQVFAITDTLIINLVPQSGNYAGIWKVAQFLQPYVSDLLTFNQPYVILLCSSAIRKELYQLFTGSTGSVSDIGNASNKSTSNAQKQVE